MLFNQLSAPRISLAFEVIFIYCINIFPTRNSKIIRMYKVGFSIWNIVNNRKYLCVGWTTVFWMMKWVKAKGEYNKQIIRTQHVSLWSESNKTWNIHTSVCVFSIHKMIALLKIILKMMRWNSLDSVWMMLFSCSE